MKNLYDSLYGNPKALSAAQIDAAKKAYPSQRKPRGNGRKRVTAADAQSALMKLNKEIAALEKKRNKAKGSAKGQLTKKINAAKKGRKAAQARVYRAKNYGKAEFEAAEQARRDLKKESRGKSSSKGGGKTPTTSKPAKTKKTTKTVSKKRKK